jgi:hypothetical protein
MYFPQVQRVFTDKHYLASRSYLTYQNEFRDTFQNSPVPNKSTISCLVNSFHDTGSVQGRNRSGRASVLSDNSLNDIHQTLLHSPGKSVRKFSLQSGLSYRSVHKATKILKLHPFCVQIMHQLFTKLHQTWGKEWMHASLNAVDISNTKYNTVFCFLISV